MVALILNLSRYLLTALLLFFVYRIVKLISRDLESNNDNSRYESPLGKKEAQNKEPVKAPVELIVLSGDTVSYKAGEAVQLRSKITIGRGTENNLVLPETTISKVHTRLWEDKGQWWVEDLDSKNGTYVNDTRLTKAVSLTNGDKIGIGSFVFQFVRWDYEVQ